MLSSCNLSDVLALVAIDQDLSSVWGGGTPCRRHVFAQHSSHSFIISLKRYFQCFPTPPCTICRICQQKWQRCSINQDGSSVEGGGIVHRCLIPEHRVEEKRTSKLLAAGQLYALTASLLEDQLSMGAFSNFYKEKGSTVVWLIYIYSACLSAQDFGASSCILLGLNYQAPWVFSEHSWH